ncbi:hypothetical protein LSH36_724g01047 [Paralvinella palmiformis]|uniref:Uncharacterized protein n=1 Tax=Paralvinella palmiformis TaxID=53620 RepID=A0AAD9MTH8_9ANNE|nr:hypothetical protein LSH36_724g01047 [Paralvinella palmiformis]
MSETSYMYRPRQASYVYGTVHELLDTHAAREPDRTAHVFWISRHNDRDNPEIKRETLTFRQLSDGSQRLALGLLALGLQPGDRIAMYGPATPEWILLDLACLRIKVVVIRMPQSLVNSRHVVDFLAKHRCRMFAIDCARETKLCRKLRKAFPGSFARCSKLPDSSRFVQVVDARFTTNNADAMTLDDVVNLSADVEIARLQSIQKNINPDDVSFVYPTSGSTGRPKLVALSHFAIVNTLHGTVKKDMVIFNDRLFSWIGSASHIASVTGCTHVHVESAYTADPENLVKFIEILTAEGVHMASMPVYLLHDVVQGLERAVLPRPPTLTALSTAGEGTPRALRARVLQLGFVHASAYGSTESGTIGVDIAIPKTSLGTSDDVSQRLTLHSGVEVKVTDELGHVLEAGKRGILWVRSRLTFLGYLDDEESTSQVLTHSGWVNSGDIAVLDPGTLGLFVHGRIADVISKGGVKIYPSTVEAVLRRHPCVKTAYVTGVPDERYQEEIGACVVLKPGCEVSEGDLVKFCENNSEMYTAITMSPRYVAIVTSVPLLATGKIDRFKVKSFLQSKMAG